MKLITPDLCTSFSCLPPKEHCRDCSHAYFFGFVWPNNLRKKFEFNPQYGVIQITLDGEPYKRQPSENSKFWDECQKWYDKKFKE